MPEFKKWLDHNKLYLEAAYKVLGMEEYTLRAWELAQPQWQRTEPVDTDLVQKWQREHGIAPAPGSREAAMVVIRHDEDGKPTVWCDPEIADLVRALNDGGVATVASCSGHGHRPGNIMLADGRVLVVCRDADEAREVESRFPGINGEAQQPAKQVRVPSDEDIERLASEHLNAHAQFVGAGEVHYEGEIEFARALLARYGRPVEPEGWQLVPKEPTEDMLVDAMEASLLGRPSADDDSYVRSIVKAWCAAAPKFGEEE